MRLFGPFAKPPLFGIKKAFSGVETFVKGVESTSAPPVVRVLAARDPNTPPNTAPTTMILKARSSQIHRGTGRRSLSASVPYCEVAGPVMYVYAVSVPSNGRPDKASISDSSSLMVMRF